MSRVNAIKYITTLATLNALEYSKQDDQYDVLSGFKLFYQDVPVKSISIWRLDKSIYLKDFDGSGRNISFYLFDADEFELYQLVK